MKDTYTFREKVWVYQGPAAWHFVTLPVNVAAQIKQAYGAHARGWGSLPVLVTVGSTSWKTSIFPDSKSSSYVLPLKAEVRKKEKIVGGTTMSFTIKIG